MLGFFADRLRRAGAMALPDDGLLVLTARAPVVPVDRALDPSEPITLWDAPDRAGRARVRFAGVGEAARVEGTGAARFDEVLGAARRLFANARELRDAGAEDAPAVRLFGGFAFRSEKERSKPWTAFGDASFVLPRWLYATDGTRPILRLTAQSAELRDPARVDELLQQTEHLLQRMGGQGRREVPQTLGAKVERTHPDLWRDMVVDALARIRAREIEKVVPAALCRVLATSDLDVGAALARMAVSYPECARFAFSRGGSVFAGVSPETLVAVTGADVVADALAGTVARTGEGDGARTRALLGSAKDLHEHGVVVEALARALGPLCASLEVPSAPRILSLRNVHHLWSPIRGTLSRGHHVLDLVRALHPTPAVSGTPREAALAWIAENEAEPRGWYAGAVGWFDGEGDGAFSVAIRSGLLARREAWLYAGAGIVEGSEASAEYAETRAKQTPMLAALGVAS